MRISSEGDRIVVRDGSEAWNPESGQLLLDFRVAELAGQMAPVARRLAHAARRSDEPLTAEQWYDLGADLETAAPDDARDAYARAVALDPRHASARVNLGRLLQDAGRPAEAAEQYRAALNRSREEVRDRLVLHLVGDERGAVENAQHRNDEAQEEKPDHHPEDA